MLQTKIHNYQEQINKALVYYLPHDDNRVAEAAEYSLLAGGKRLRPILLLAWYQTLTGKNPSREVVRAACSVEYAHTFSLIHDDLPAIDNDTLRRGRPTCHVRFDEATAILAGDYLYGLALENITRGNLEPELKTALISDLGSGMRAVIKGEMLDIIGETTTHSQQLLELTFIQKTCALFQTTLVMASRLAGWDQPRQLTWVKKAGLLLGLSFQIQDDVLGEIGESEKLGKSVGIDREAGKSTWVKLHGLVGSQITYERYYQQVYALIQEKLPINDNRQFLLDLITYLKSRDH